MARDIIEQALRLVDRLNKGKVPSHDYDYSRGSSGLAVPATFHTSIIWRADRWDDHVAGQLRSILVGHTLNDSSEPGADADKSA